MLSVIKFCSQNVMMIENIDFTTDSFRGGKYLAEGLALAQ
jgi:hypothetical protein